MDMIAAAELEKALKEPSILDALAYTGIDIRDLEFLLRGSLSQRQIVSRVIVGLTNSPFFK